MAIEKEEKERRELRREDVLEALRRIALSRPNAAVELAYMDSPSRRTIQGLDLWAVSEFKRNSAGAVEIRFLDRVKALDTLGAMLGGGEASEAAEFFRALGEMSGEDEAWPE